MKENVIQIGYLDNKELYKYQSIADFAIVPSVWNEPAGLVVLEAQAAGLPVVASNVGGIPEFLCKDAGILVDRNENYIDNLSIAINKMIDMKDKYKFMRESGKKWAKNYDLNRYYNEFLNNIEQLKNIN